MGGRETDNGTTVIGFEHAIIAAGSQATEIPVFPNDDPRLMDSTDALEMADVPERMLVIGGGIIGLEMATACRYAEGVDYLGVSRVMFLNCAESYSAYRQRVGRVLRACIHTAAGVLEYTPKSKKTHHVSIFTYMSVLQMGQEYDVNQANDNDLQSSDTYFYYRLRGFEKADYTRWLVEVDWECNMITNATEVTATGLESMARDLSLDLDETSMRPGAGGGFYDRTVDVSDENTANIFSATMDDADVASPSRARAFGSAEKRSSSSGTTGTGTTTTTTATGTIGGGSSSSGAAEREMLASLAKTSEAMDAVSAAAAVAEATLQRAARLMLA